MHNRAEVQMSSVGHGSPHDKTMSGRACFFVRPLLCGRCALRADGFRGQRGMPWSA